MRDYRHLAAGIVTYLVVFAVSYVVWGSLAVSLGLGAVFGVAAGLTVYSLLPADRTLVNYQLDVRRRVKTVLADTDYIATNARKVKDQDSRAALARATNVIRDLLSLAQQKDPRNIAQTTARVGVYIGSVKTALDAQLQIEQHPEYWPNSDQLLAANRQGFQDFEKFALTAVQHLNQGDASALRAKLQLLKPMPTPDLST